MLIHLFHLYIILVRMLQNTREVCSYIKTSSVVQELSLFAKDKIKQINTPYQKSFRPGQGKLIT